MRIENNKYRKSNPFGTPEGYFEELHNKVMEQVLQQQQPKQKNSGIWKKRIIEYAAVAIFIVAAGISLFNYTTDKSHTYTATYESEEQLIEDFIDNYPIDEYILYSYLTSTDTGF